MRRYTTTRLIIMVLLNVSFSSIVRAHIIPMCETLKNVKDYEDQSLLKLRSVRALCDIFQPSQSIASQEDADIVPGFDLNQINTENDANQILKRFRRGRFSSGGSRSSSSGSRSSSSSSRSSSGSGSRWSSSSGSSRIFSRSGSSSSSSGSRGGLFSRTSSSGTSGTRSHRVRESVRSMFRKPVSSGSGSSHLPGAGGSKPGLSDKIRKITHGTGGGVGGSRFGTGSSGGSGGNVWVRTGKTFLPHAVRFGKRYYQRRKYNKGMYAGIGAGAGYYAGSRMNNRYGQDHSYDNYGYPPTVDDDGSAQIDGKTPTVFFCLQQDLNTTLVNKTLDADGFGVCNISGQLITCPVEIECKISEADNCCEDEQGTPYCCGGPIPTEYTSQYGGYEDDWRDAAESINQILNIITAICILIATVCLTIWQRRE